jgi:hypothetical protein
MYASIAVPLALRARPSPAWVLQPMLSIFDLTSYKLYDVGGCLASSLRPLFSLEPPWSKKIAKVSEGHFAACLLNIGFATNSPQSEGD